MPSPVNIDSLDPVPAKPPTHKKRGFAAMDPEKVKAISSKGGKAAHTAGTAHQFSSDEARNAGRKGGVAPHVRRGRGPKRPPPTPPVEVQEKLPLSGES